MEAGDLMILSGTLFCLIGILGMPLMPMSIFPTLDPPEGMPLMSYTLIFLGLALVSGGVIVKTKKSR